MCNNDFFQNFKDVVIVKDFKYSLIENISKKLWQIGRNCPNCQFLGQNGHFSLKNGSNNGQNIFFSVIR